MGGARPVERGLGSLRTSSRSSKVRESLLAEMNGTRLSIPCQNNTHAESLIVGE